MPFKKNKEPDKATNQYDKALEVSKNVMMTVTDHLKLGLLTRAGCEYLHSLQPQEQ